MYHLPGTGGMKQAKKILFESANVCRMIDVYNAAG